MLDDLNNDYIPVNPARAGMIHPCSEMGEEILRKPRASGDDPAMTKLAWDSIG